jgi:hypothetical protein
MISSHEFDMSRKCRLTRTCPVATLQGLHGNPELSSRSETSWVGWNTRAVQWDEKREGRTRNLAVNYDYVHEHCGCGAVDRLPRHGRCES